jgi:hypothetical protein
MACDMPLHEEGFWPASVGPASAKRTILDPRFWDVHGVNAKALVL